MNEFIANILSIQFEMHLGDMDVHESKSNIIRNTKNQWNINDFDSKPMFDGFFLSFFLAGIGISIIVYVWTEQCIYIVEIYEIMYPMMFWMNFKGRISTQSNGCLNYLLHRKWRRFSYFWWTLILTRFL